MAKKGGRPSGLTDQIIGQATKLARLGLTDKEMAAVWGVTESTVTRWKKKSAEFCVSLKAGKAESDGNVVDRLYQRALGYSHDSEEIKVVEGKIIRVPIIKHYPPDTTAAIFWLKNRQRDKWRDKHDHEHSGAVEITKIVREIVRAPNSDG